MKHILMIEFKGGYWKQVFSGGYGTDSYDKCINETTKLDTNSSWMIVAEKRVHMGGEPVEIKKEDQGNMSNFGDDDRASIYRAGNNNT